MPPIHWEQINKRLITFCAVGLLFLGSLYYLVSIAFQTESSLSQRQINSQQVEDYFNEL